MSPRDSVRHTPGPADGPTDGTVPGTSAGLSRRLLLRRTGVAAAAVVGVALTGCTAAGLGTVGGPRLVCRHQRSEEVYAETPLVPGMLVTHSWRHSIELSRWSDTYRCTAVGLTLIRTEFEAYGAGMPMDEGQVRLEDGKVIIEDIDRPFEAVRWIHSHEVDYRISIDGDDSLIDAETLPHREPLELRPL